MKKVLLLLIAIMFIVPSVLAADLDAPAGKVVTVRTEIERGNSAIFDASAKHEITDTLGFFSAVNKIIEKNTQNNTDTDAFLLGAYFKEWKETEKRYRILKEHNLLSASMEEYLPETMKNTLEQAKHYQMKLNITDEELFKLILTTEDQKSKYINK